MNNIINNTTNKYIYIASDDTHDEDEEVCGVWCVGCGVCGSGGGVVIIILTFCCVCGGGGREESISISDHIISLLFSYFF